MRVAIAGTYRVPPENFARLKPHLDAVLSNSRAEDGCEIYSHAQDVQDPGLIRVFEIWRDPAAFDGHQNAPHVAVWRAACAELGVSDRALSLYEIAAEQPL
jgi:quinol monooxygenase YgiN